MSENKSFPGRSGAPTFTVLVPMYNEEENIQAFHARIVAVMDSLGKPYEIICVNDGSTDRTYEHLVQLNTLDPRVKVIDLSRNFGKECAMSAGLRAASGDAVIIIDADLQDPPELIPRLVEKWGEFDVVYATRSERKEETLLKKVTAFGFYRVMNYLSGLGMPKDTGDFRLMDRKVVDALNRLTESHRFMKGLFSWVGFRQTGILYSRDSRYRGKTKFNYRKLFAFAFEGITSFSSSLLRISTWIGSMVSLAAFVYGTYMIVTTLLHGNRVPGYPSLIVITLFLGGVNLLMIGILGEYLGRIYDETKDRPLYFTREMIGFDDAREHAAGAAVIADAVIIDRKPAGYPVNDKR